MCFDKSLIFHFILFSLILKIYSNFNMWGEKIDNAIGQYYNNKNLIFPYELVENATIHMIKILPINKGSSPIIEICFDKKDKWQKCNPHNFTWGKKGATYKYSEDMVRGSYVAFGNYNHIYDVCYYMCKGFHPCNLFLYNETKEAKKMERFIFFKFTATVARNSHLFENHLDNFMLVIDTNTKLLFSYGAPTDYENIIGDNFLPIKWLPYETHPLTASSNLKFYQYDPIGYIKETWDVLVDNITTNVVLYDWWLSSIKAGYSYKTIKAKRFMPRISKNANLNYMIRKPDIPIASPYRNEFEP